MNRNNITISILTAIVLIWLINSIFSALRTKILDITRPALSASYQISHKVKSFIFAETGLAKKNNLLKSQIEVMKAKIAGLDEFVLENKRLKKLLDFKKSASRNAVSAQVIGRDPSNWTSIIYIDKGADDNIKKYMAVTTDKGLVGRVIEAGQASAKVMFITDPDSRIGILIQRTRHDGLLCGTLSRQCRMLYIHLEADIWPGDLVVSSGLGGSFPKGLMIGTVEDVFIDKSGLYQTAVIKPSVDLSRVEEVLCVE